MFFFVLKAPCSPVSGATAPMRHGDDLNIYCCSAIDYGVGKTREEKLPRTVQVRRPVCGAFRNLSDGLIERRHERIRRGGIALRIPQIGSSCLGYGLGMEFNAWTSHRTVRGSGGAPRTRKLALPFPDLNRQGVWQSLYSTLARRPRLRSHPSFRADDRQARRVPQPEDTKPLPKPFCERPSCFQIIRRGAFLQSMPRSVLGLQRGPLQCLDREWLVEGGGYERRSSPETQARLRVQEVQSNA